MLLTDRGDKIQSQAKGLAFDRRISSPFVQEECFFFQLPETQLK